MADLLTVKHQSFTDAMNEKFESDEHITSLNIFDTFVHTLSHDSNVLSEEKLKGLVFRQFKEYGDFDKIMEEMVQSVSDIKQSTQDAMTAMSNNDSGGLKSAYNQLKSYEERILKLEEAVYTDDITGVYNRKFLLNHELNETGEFKHDGTLFHIRINNFAQINKEHGHESGDAVLKYVSKNCQNKLKSIGVHFIRYMGVQFLAMAKKSVASKANVICEETVAAILSKRFKAHDGTPLTIELELGFIEVKKEESFQKVYETL